MDDFVAAFPFAGILLTSNIRVPGIRLDAYDQVLINLREGMK